MRTDPETFLSPIAPETGVIRDKKAMAWVAAAAITAVVLRLFYAAFVVSPRLTDDETSFWAIAGNLAHGRGFSYLGQATAPAAYEATVVAEPSPLMIVTSKPASFQNPWSSAAKNGACLP